MATERSTVARVFRALRDWRERRDGAAAMEFALLVPVMLTFLLGMTEVTLGVAINRKLTGLSRSVVDLASRVSAISTSDMANIFAASTSLMQPYATTNLKMVLSSIKVTQAGSNYLGTVDWSCAKGSGATARAANSAYPVPAGFQTAASYFLVAETTIPYVPLFGYSITGTITLRKNTPWPIRNTVQVTGPSSCPS